MKNAAEYKAKVITILQARNLVENVCKDMGYIGSSEAVSSTVYDIDYIDPNDVGGNSYKECLITAKFVLDESEESEGFVSSTANI